MSKYTKKKLRKMHEDWSGEEVISIKVLDEVAVVLDEGEHYYDAAPISIYPANPPYTSHPVYSSLSADEAEMLGKTLIKMAKKARKRDLD